MSTTTPTDPDLNKIIETVIADRQNTEQGMAPAQVVATKKIVKKVAAKKVVAKKVVAKKAVAKKAVAKKSVKKAVAKKRK